jgi:PIN domain nuclease of toxin-antitoxin system
VTDRLLLDTHTFLWYDRDPARLPPRASGLIRAASAEVYVSAVTAWELAIKYQAGKLPSAGPSVQNFHATLAAYDFIELSLTALHALRAGGFAHAHKDPFDRALAAQALLEQLTLVSADAALDGFGVMRVWD